MAHKSMGKRSIRAMAAVLMIFCLVFGGMMGDVQSAWPVQMHAKADGNTIAEDGTVDGTKIEETDIFWLTPDSAMNNVGVATPETDPDGKNVNLFLATASDAPLRMTFQFEVALSGQYDYQPGDIRITLPAYVWQTRELNAAGEGVAHTTERQGKIDLSVPEAPASNADFEWTMVGDNYVITNARRISATSKAMFQASVIDLMPHNVVDMVDCDPISFTCEVTTHKNEIISLSSDSIKAKVDTIAAVNRSHKSSMEMFEYYPGEGILPNELLQNLPEGAEKEDYIYVRWYSYVYHYGNQPFTLSVQDKVLDAYELVDGQKAYVDGGNGIYLGMVGVQSTEVVSNDEKPQVHQLLHQHHQCAGHQAVAGR